MTALHAARYAPERVASMVIASATAGGPEHRSFDISAFLDLPREKAAVEALCLQDTRNNVLRQTCPDMFEARMTERVAFEAAFANPSISSGGYARLLSARRGHDATAGLHAITTPTLVIAGRFDTQARPESQRSLSETLPHAIFHSFDAGHGVLFATQDAISAALGFLAQNAGAGTMA